MIRCESKGNRERPREKKQNMETGEEEGRDRDQT